MFYSATTGGFYSPEKHADKMPADAVELSDDEYSEVMRLHSTGLVIVPGEGGRPTLAEPAPPTPEQQVVIIRDKIQLVLDDEARKYGYDDIKAAVTYADEPSVAKFQAEGRAFRAWRSLVWAYAYEVLADVQSGAREQPTADELIAELPALVLP